MHGKIRFSLGGEDITGEVEVPFGGEHSNGLNDWKDFILARDVILSKGVQSMKVSISGDSASFVLNSITIEKGSDHACSDSIPSITPSYRKEPGIFYYYYEGAWNSLPDFDTLAPVAEGLTDSIKLLDGIAADSFALVFEGYIDIPMLGSYTFYTFSGEGSRMFIDGIEVVDNDGLHDAVEQSGDICLAEGFHEIRVEYFEKTGSEDLEVMYSGPGISKQVISGLYGVGPCPNIGLIPPDDLTPGLMYTYYEGTWNNLPDFESLSPVNRGITSIISTGPAEASDHYALTFDAHILIEESGEYTFYTASDDGSRLIINDMEIVSNDGTHGVEEKSGNLCLEAGYHKIRVEYFEKTGGNSVSAQMEGQGISKSNLTNLFTAPLPPKSDQVITFNALDTVARDHPDFSPGATASSGLTVSYTSSDTGVATIVDGKIRLVDDGNTLITASQAGNGAYNAAEDVQQWLVVLNASKLLQNKDEKTIVFYPNPVSDKLAIKRTNTDKAELEIFNALGRLVLSATIEKEESMVDVSVLDKGVYLARITYRNGMTENTTIIKID